MEGMLLNLEMERRLIDEAMAAQKKAYAPYSGFHVGAALLGVNGVIYRGCNVENLSYGLTICAERVALCRAVADGHQQFEAMAIVTASQEPASPCGACRQCMAEFNADLPLILGNLEGRVVRYSLRELFPRAQTGILGRE